MLFYIACFVTSVAICVVFLILLWNWLTASLFSYLVAVKRLNIISSWTVGGSTWLYRICAPRLSGSTRDCWFCNYPSGFCEEKLPFSSENFQKIIMFSNQTYSNWKTSWSGIKCKQVMLYFRWPLHLCFVIFPFQFLEYKWLTQTGSVTHKQWQLISNLRYYCEKVNTNTCLSKQVL